jgi:hypothetical protein
MNENITYFQTVETRPASYSNGQTVNGTIQYEPQQQIEFHTPVVSQFHGGNTFITTGPVSV